MPLPPPPPLTKPRRVKGQRALWQAAMPLEERPILFPDLEATLYDKDIRKVTGLRCRTCLRFERCTLGPQQMLQCFAHFLWHPTISTNPNLIQESHTLATCPLSEEAINAFVVQDLLGVYYTRHFSLWTVVDISRRGLRARLHTIQADSRFPSPYRLTTE